MILWVLLAFLGGTIFGVGFTIGVLWNLHCKRCGEKLMRHRISHREAEEDSFLIDFLER